MHGNDERPSEDDPRQWRLPPDQTGDRRPPESIKAPSTEEETRAAARELGHIFTAAYGKGAGKVTAQYVGDDAMICLFEELEFQPHERSQIEAGHGVQLLRMRTLYEQAIETTFRTAVEHCTGRRVRSFNSMAEVDPPMSIELFMFEPTD